MHNKVLILEKSASSKYLFKKCLNDLGYECDSFNQLESAQKALTSNNYCLVVAGDNFVKNMGLLQMHKGPTIITSALMTEAPKDMSLLAKPMTLETIYQAFTAELGGTIPSLLAA